MQGSFKLGLLIATAGLTVACADTRRSGPTALPQDAALVITAAGCDFTAMRRDARSYLSSTDPILDILRALQDAVRAGSLTLAYDTGLNALARMAEARNLGITNAPSAGASLALGILTCIDVPKPWPTLAELTSSLGTDPNGGIFQILGGGIAPFGAVVAVSASPRWGAEPQPGKTWANSTTLAGARFLLYAYRITFGSFTTEEPALLNPGSTDELGTAFEMRTIPAGVLTHYPLVGVCVENQDRYRMQWTQNILMLQQVNFCPTTTSATKGGSRVLAAARRAIEWLAPTPLHASAFIVGGTGGLPSGFSPFGAVDVDAAAIQLTIDPIPDGNRTTPFNITVRATSPNGNPVDNVLIVLSVAGNNGLGSDGEYELIGVQGATANGGVVTLNVLLDKAGAFKVRADGYFNALPPNLPTLSATSNRFNIGS
jgi:hypothetical protein